MKYSHIAFTWFGDQTNKLFILIIQSNSYFEFLKHGLTMVIVHMILLRVQRGSLGVNIYNIWMEV